MEMLLRPINGGRAQLGALFRLAIAAGVPAAVQIQLRRGAPLDGRDASGRSPLMLAALRGHLDLCLLLLRQGADCRLTDDEGRDAAGLALAHGHPRIVRLIEEQLSHTAVGYPDRGMPSAPVAEAFLEPKERRSLSDAIPETEQAAPEGADTPSGAVEEPGLMSTEAKPLLMVAPPEAAVEASSRDLLAAAEGEDPGRGLDPDRAVQASACSSPAIPYHDAPVVDDIKEDEGSEWEAEDDQVLPISDMKLEAAATIMNRGFAIHQPIVDEADWSDIEIELPTIRPLWARSFREDFDAVRHIDGLLAAAIFEGRIAVPAIESFLSNTLSGGPDEQLRQNLVAALEAVGLVIEDEAPFPSSDRPPELGRGRVTYDRSIIRDIMEFLEDIAAAPLSDVGLLDLELRRSSPPSSAADERRLFLDHQTALDTLVRAVAPHPSVRLTIAGWLQRIERGDLPVQQVTRHGSEAMSDGDDEEASAASLSTTDTMRRAMRQLLEAVPAEGSDGSLAAGIIGLALTPPRIVEMARRVCSSGAATGEADCSMPASHGTSAWDHVGPAAAGSMQDPLPSTKAVIRNVEGALQRYLTVRDRILKANLRMVVWQSRRYMTGPILVADLVQDGMIGLLRSIERFDPGKGSRFATYAIWWIRQSMTRSVADTGRTIRVPVHVHDSRNRFRKTIDSLQARLGRPPDIEELAAALGQPAAAVLRLQRPEIEMVPIDRVLLEEQEEPEDDGWMIKRPAGMIGFEPSPLDTLLHADLRRCLRHGLSRLDPRQQRILALRFGLEDDIPRTLEEVGQIHGVTRERIRQIEVKALRRLRLLLPARSFEAMQP